MTVDFDDQVKEIDELNSALDDTKGITDLVNSSTEELAELFGAAGIGVQQKIFGAPTYLPDDPASGIPCHRNSQTCGAMLANRLEMPCAIGVLAHEVVRAPFLDADAEARYAIALSSRAI